MYIVLLFWDRISVALLSKSLLCRPCRPSTQRDPFYLASIWNLNLNCIAFEMTSFMNRLFSRKPCVIHIARLLRDTSHVCVLSDCRVSDHVQDFGLLALNSSSWVFICFLRRVFDLLIPSSECCQCCCLPSRVRHVGMYIGVHGTLAVSL